MTDRPFAVNLFCGAGGTGWGIRKFYDAVGYDNWLPAVNTHNANGMKAILADLNVRLPIVKSRVVDLIWASCPCQPFSNALEQQGQFDPRDGFPAYLRTLKKFMPRLTIFENVAGLTYKRHAAYLATIVRKITELGYRVEARILDASDYRVPQVRRRYILIGRLDGPPIFPEISDKPKITVRQALGTDGTDNPVGVEVRYLKTPTFTQGYKGSLLYNGRGRPLDLDAPSKTIYAAGGNHVHWFDTENVSVPYWEELNRGGEIRKGAVPGARRLTVDQMALLQGFPKSFEFTGPPSIQVKQIGNAVPPKMARAIVKANLAA